MPVESNKQAKDKAITIISHATNNSNRNPESATANTGRTEMPRAPAVRKAVQAGTAHTAGNPGESSKTAKAGKITLRELAKAVAKAEGWGSPNSLARKLSNPCNIRARGNLGKYKGFGKFSTAELGFQSCEKTLRFYISRGKTLQQMINYFSPESDGNNPTQHAANIAKFAKIALHTPLNQIVQL